MKNLKKKLRKNLSLDELFLDKEELLIIEEDLKYEQFDKIEYLNNDFPYSESGFNDSNVYFLKKNLHLIENFNLENKIFLNNLKINEDQIYYKNAELNIHLTEIKNNLNYESNLYHINFLKNINNDILNLYSVTLIYSKLDWNDIDEHLGHSILFTANKYSKMELSINVDDIIYYTSIIGKDVNIYLFNRYVNHFNKPFLVVTNEIEFKNNLILLRLLDY